jgi:hypothetical protein
VNRFRTIKKYRGLILQIRDRKTKVNGSGSGQKQLISDHRSLRGAALLNLNVLTVSRTSFTGFAGGGSSNKENSKDEEGYFLAHLYFVFSNILQNKLFFMR